MKHLSLLRWPSGAGRHMFTGVVLGLVALLGCHPAQAQTAQEPFGRVRLQYKDFDWQLLSTQNFNVYYYGGGDVSARRAADYAEKELQRITSLVGYYPYSKTTVMLYNSVSDLRQSNIGLDTDKYQTGGETDLLRMSKVQIAFQGQQTLFKRDLSYQVTRVLLNDMMYGGSLKEVIQSTYLLQLPDWFVSGASAYAAEGWSVEMDDYMRDMTAQYEGNRTAPIFLRNPQLAGQSLWNYIAERYGYTTIQNILNLTRITRDVEVGISSSLNVPYKVFLKDWLAYYRQLNAQPQTAFVDPEDARALRSQNRRNILYTQPVLSPNGQQLAYVSNDRGRYRVLVANRDGSGRHTILRGGYKTPDQQVENRLPVLAWRGNSQVAVAEIDKGEMSLHLQPASGGASSLFSRIKDALPFIGDKGSTIFAPFQQVLNLSYSPDGKSLVFSGVQNGQADLYVLRAGNRRAEKLTNDVFDDIEPVFLPGGSGIVFSSNRWLDSAGTARGSFGAVVNNYDLFLYHLDGRAQPVEQLVSTISNEGRPRAISDDEILYLGEESGIRSIYRYSLRTKQRTAVSSFRPNVKDFDYNAASSTLGFVAADRARDFVYLYPTFPLPESVTLYKTARQETLEDRSKPAPTTSSVTIPAPSSTTTDPGTVPATTTEPQATQPARSASAPINTSDYQFDEDLPADRTTAGRRQRTPTVVAKPTPAPAAITGAPAGPFRYDTRFSIDNVVSSLAADPLLGIGLVGQVSMSDLFENHRIRAGIFALTDLRTSNIFAEYTNLKRRYDWSIRYDKQAYFFDLRNGARVRFGRHEVAPTLAYPLTHNLSVRGGPRFVNVSRSVLDELSGQDDLDNNYLGASGELVFDNAIKTGVNMLEGTRMKIGVFKLHNLDYSNQDFGKLYVDLRHYQKVHRQIIWANRASYGQFFGQADQFFRLGGMDNWLNMNYEGDKTIPLDPTQMFYQQFVTNLRGFNYSKRTGPRYVLFNSELRVPIVQYLSRKPIYSGFFRNLQLTAFGDAGTAYSGNNPFNENNSFNTKVVGGGGNAFSATVTNFGNPLLVGYGFGVRTTLLGFYGKADVAWGQEDYVEKGPKFYFTLGYDF